MNRFDSDKGLFHITFANEEDDYYTKSGVRLSLNQYLFCELKNNGFQAVVFFGGSKNTCFCRAVDISVSPEKSLLFGLLKAKNDASAGRVRYDMVKESEFYDYMQQMIKLMREKSRLAFVFEVETFNLIAAYDDIIDELYDVSLCNHRQSFGHICLVKVPKTVNGSLPYFTDKKSVFRSELFPTIGHILEQKRNIHIYDELKAELGDSVTFLNTFDRQSVYPLVLNSFIEHERFTSESFAKLDDYTDFIWAWYNYRDFKIYAGSEIERAFADNPKQTYKNIQKCLAQKTFVDTMNRKINALRNGDDTSPFRVLIEPYCRNTEHHNLVADVNGDMTVKKLEKIYHVYSVKAQQNTDYETVKFNIISILNQLKRTYITQAEDRETQEYMELFLKLAYDVCSNTFEYDEFDSRSVAYAVKALKYAVDGFFEINLDRFAYDIKSKHHSDEFKKADKCNKIYLSILQTASKLFDLEKSYHTLCRKVERLIKERNEAILESKEYEIAHQYAADEISDAVSGNSLSAESLELKNKMSKAIAINNSVEQSRSVMLQMEQAIDNCKKLIRNMEMSIEMNFADHMVSIEDMEELISTTNRNIVENNAVMKKVNQTLEGFDDMMTANKKIQADDALNDSGGVLKEYQILIDQLSKNEGKNEEMEITNKKAVLYNG